LEVGRTEEGASVVSDSEVLVICVENTEVTAKKDFRWTQIGIIF